METFDACWFFGAAKVAVASLAHNLDRVWAMISHGRPGNLERLELLAINLQASLAECSTKLDDIIRYARGEE